MSFTSKETRPFTVAESEWETACHYLKGKPDGTKLTYSASLNMSGTALLPRRKKGKLYAAIEAYNRNHPEQPLDQTTHSFVILGGKIYAIAQGFVLGEGTYGKVKYLLDEDQTVFVLKKEVPTSDDPLQPEELEVLQDRNLSMGRHQVRQLDYAEDDSKKQNTPVFYTQMTYAGITLRKLTSPDPQDKDPLPELTDEERLDIGIDLCLELHDFHYLRRKSQSKTAYAHLDLKLDNITRDQQGKLHLIDFGFTVSNPANRPSRTGAQLYKPKTGAVNKLDGEAYDVFALKRCLFMPNELWCDVWYHVSDARSTPGVQGILNETIMAHPDINKYVYTGSTEQEKKYYNDDKIGACALGAILIAAKLNLSISADDLATNLEKALLVTGIYKLNPLTAKTAIEEALADETHIRALAAFFAMDCHENLDTFMADTDFSAAMAAADSHKKACMLLFLKLLQMDALYYVCLDNEEITDGLYALYRQPKKLWSPVNIKMLTEIPGLARLINFLEGEALQRHFPTLLDSPDLYNALIPLMKADENKYLLSFLLQNDFQPDALLNIFRDAAVKQALVLLQNSGSVNIEHYRKVIQNPPLAQAMLDFASYKTDSFFPLPEKLAQSSPKIWEAVSIYKARQKHATKIPNFIDWINHDHNAIITQERAAAICFLGKNNLSEFIHEDMPDSVLFALAEGENHLEKADLERLLNDDKAVGRFQALCDCQHIEAATILFKYQGLEDKDIVTLQSQPGFAETIIYLQQDPDLLERFLTSDNDLLVQVMLDLSSNKGLSDTMIPALLKDDSIPADRDLIAALTQLKKKPWLVPSLIDALGKRLDGILSTEDALADTLTAIDAPQNRRLLLKQLNGQKLLALINDLPAFIARLNNPAIENDLTLFCLKIKLEDYLKDKHGLLTTELQALLKTDYTDAKKFQNDCISKLQAAEHSPMTDTIYALLLAQTNQDIGHHKRFTARVAEAFVFHKKASSLRRFGFYSAGFFAVTAAVFALGVFAIPVLGQLTLAGLVGVSVIAGVIAVTMAYVLPKICSCKGAESTQAKDNETAGDQAYNGSSRTMSRLGGQVPSIQEHEAPDATAGYVCQIRPLLTASSCDNATPVEQGLSIRVNGASTP